MIAHRAFSLDHEIVFRVNI